MCVGTAVEGSTVGCTVLFFMDGTAVFEGISVDGRNVVLGLLVVGTHVGVFVGLYVGIRVGRRLGGGVV